ncbi:MAG: hypothetical protein ACFFG0_27335 [Candidatus Thorarchaeota archaeon]
MYKSIYKNLQKEFTIKKDIKKYSELVWSNGNNNAPIQRWFSLKESFSIDLLEELIKDWDITLSDNYKVLDPFCGCGTSLLSIQKIAKKHGVKHIETIGYEQNPFIYFTAKNKVNWNTYDLDEINNAIEKISQINLSIEPQNIPQLSTLNRKDIISPKTLKKALLIKEAINKLNGKEKDLLLLGFARIIESISSVKKDGRALRIVKNKKKKRLMPALKQSWKDIVEDLEKANEHYFPSNINVILGDGRKIKERNKKNNLENINLIIYSPPYMNNFDYSEIYKMELWMCDMIKNYDEFKLLRKKTFRSHHSINFNSPITYNQDKKLEQIHNIIEDIIKEIPQNKYFSRRAKVIREYFDDMYKALVSQKEVLIKDGWIFCIVGNSFHGIPIAVDLIIAKIARAIGLKIEAIQLARQINHRIRKSTFLRESIIVMRK